jgi:hypothetical protein
MSRSLICLAIAACTFAAGCDSSSPGTNGSSGEAQTREISKADLPKGDRWPLTVNSGLLRCEGSNGFGAVVFRAPDGMDYGVNGVALGKHFADIKPIWRKDPDSPGLRIDIGPLIDIGLTLCR